ncbi:YoaK family protein [Aquabacterium sp.]|uniref:YoaK family protein n=1 Tax=Aquabacterium sp. TaxID=1872578 RepID=UPI0035AD986D
MPAHYLRRLTGPQRDQAANRHLGYSLTFIAGAANAGGFLAVGQYTSHMSGIVSGMADALALGNLWMAAAAVVALAAFVGGAATTAVLTNWARLRQLRSQYALSLLLEAALLLVFGMSGAFLATQRELLLPATVVLLCFIMGLQNAIITKISKAEIRTTHVTGLVTDLGIELGKLAYYNRARCSPRQQVRANRDKLGLHLRLLLSFASGGLVGALAFKHLGFSATLPLAAWLTVLAALPVLDDLRAYWAARYMR